MMRSPRGALLCVSNYRANRGFAWDFIEGLYARIADNLAKQSIPTLVAYPSIPSAPRSLEGSAARAVALDCSLDTPESVNATTQLIRDENVCACRATPEKGVAHFLRAFDRVVRAGNGNRPVALYVGDGPQMSELQQLREALSSKNDIILTGYLNNASEIVNSADVCVIP